MTGEEHASGVVVTADDGVLPFTTRGFTPDSGATWLVDAMADEALMLEMSSPTADFREGLRAFTERRPARFEGR